MPGEPPYPLGVYGQPPPSNFTFIEGHDLGDGLLPTTARRLTSAANDVNKFFNDLNPLP